MIREESDIRDDRLNNGLYRLMTSGTEILKDLFCGCMSGWGQVVTMLPFENIKIHMVSNPNKYSSILTSLLTIVREEGLLSLYKGMLMPLIGVGGQVALQFGIVETAKKVLKQKYADENGELPFSLLFFAGMLAGIPSGILGAFLDLARFQVVNSATKMGSVAMARSIYRAHGMQKMFWGIGPSMLRDSAGMGIYFTTYRSLLQQFQKNEDGRVPVFNTLFSGGMAGVMFWLCMYPVDYVKTLMQTEKDLSKPRFKSGIQCAKEQYQSHGGKIFVTGLPIMMMRAFPVNAVGFLCFEFGKQLVYPKVSLS